MSNILIPATNRYSKPSGKWIVDIKGMAGSRSFEISVLREDNQLGIKSYGWFGSDKLLITHNGGPCQWPLDKIVWSKAVKLAHEVADELNGSSPINTES
jgi:hypothetical protein